jgi:hypothetical protein
VVNDSPLDDRDSGVLCIGGRRLLLSWFSSDSRVEVLAIGLYQIVTSQYSSKTLYQGSYHIQ